MYCLDENKGKHLQQVERNRSNGICHHINLKSRKPRIIGSP